MRKPFVRNHYTERTYKPITDNKKIAETFNNFFKLGFHYGLT